MFSVCRSIGFDYGHRVLTHGSKCRSIHGHRGTVEVTCEGASLHESGEQTDMVLDFGFLKDVMMEVVDASIDHGFIAYYGDNFAMSTFNPWCTAPSANWQQFLELAGEWQSTIEAVVRLKGFCSTLHTKEHSKLYVVDFIPTSERLAEHFFHRLQKPIEERSLGKAKLTNLRFWETPNCYSDYPGFSSQTTKV